MAASKKPADNQQHAKFPPSLMDRVLACPGSFALEATQPHKESFFTDEGHAAHQLAQWALTDGKFDTRAYLGKVMTFHQHKGTPQETKFDFTVDETMCQSVQGYVDNVYNSVEKFKADKKVANVTLHVEARLDTSKVLGVPKQFGMADTVIVVEYKDGTGYISVEDLKYGAGVKVVADKNTQLMTYGAAAVLKYGKDLDVKKIGLVIHMPRLGYVSAYEASAKELKAFVKTLKNGTADALEQQRLLKEQGVAALTLNAGDKQCRFCKAQKTCAAFNEAVKLGKIEFMKNKKPYYGPRGGNKPKNG